MKEILYEESAFPINSGREATIYNILRVTSIVFFAIGIFVASTGLSSGYSYFVLNNDVEYLYTFLSALAIAVIFVIIGIIFMIVKNKFNVVYDYTFVSGEIRISRVLGNKRKLVYEIKPREISKIGKTSDRMYENLHYQHIREIRFTKNKAPVKGKDFYYFYGNDSMGKNMVVLECREDMIKNMSYYVPKDVLE